MKTALQLVLGFAVVAHSLAAMANPHAEVGGQIRWTRDAQTASREAQQCGKKVLLQVTATWCGACQQMFRQTYSDPRVIDAVNEGFVPLMVDADEHPEVIQRLSIRAFPTTVILATDSPSMEAARVEGFLSVDAFLGWASRFAAPAQTRFSTVSHDLRRSESASSQLPPFRPIVPLEQAQSKRAAHSQEVRLAISQMPERQKSPVVSSQVAAEVAFGGLCLVSTLLEKRPVAGSSSHTCIYRGVRLQFRTAEQLVKFKSKPGQYWPWLDGHCPVAMFDSTEQQPKASPEAGKMGNPQIGGLHRDRVIFFRDEAHRDLFARNPEAYIPEARHTQLARAN